MRVALFAFVVVASLLGQAVAIPAGTCDPSLMVIPGGCCIQPPITSWLYTGSGPSAGEYMTLVWPSGQVASPRNGTTYVALFVLDPVTQTFFLDPIVFWRLDPVLPPNYVLPTWTPPTSDPCATTVDIQVGGLSVWFKLGSGLVFTVASVWFVPDQFGMVHVTVGTPVTFST